MKESTNRGHKMGTRNLNDVTTSSLKESGHKTATEKIPEIKATYRASYVDKTGKSCIYLECRLQAKKIRFNTGIKMESKFWDVKKNTVSKNHPMYEDLNLIITTCKAKLNNIFVKYRLKDKDLNFEILREEYERPTQAFDYLEWLAKAIDERRGEVTDSSLKQFRAHMMKLKGFKNEVAFAELSEELFTQFNRYLKVDLKNGSNTRWNTLKTHRTFINIAKRKGIIEENPLDKMPVKRAQTDRVFLDEVELKTLVDLYRSNWLEDNHQRVLRHFLFSCHTGLRISDLQRVRMEDIIGNILILVPYKTKNSSRCTVRVPLTKIALELIHDESPFRIKGLLFNTYSEPRMRLFLKLIIAHAKIKKNVVFHSSRHTFATIFLKKTNNLAALQKLLGHQNITQTMIYPHIITDDLVREMDQFDGI
jgi:integrase